MVTKAQREVEKSMFLSLIIHLRLHVNFVHSIFFRITQGTEL